MKRPSGENAGVYASPGAFGIRIRGWPPFWASFVPVAGISASRRLPVPSRTQAIQRPSGDTSGSCVRSPFVSCRIEPVAMS